MGRDDSVMLPKNRTMPLLALALGCLAAMPVAPPARGDGAAGEQDASVRPQPPRVSVLYTINNFGYTDTCG